VAILLRIAYDGTEFRGFARQDGLRTVQGTLEAALSELYEAPVEIRGASRTDSGVHARGQSVAYDPPGSGPPPERVRMALWGMLPPDLEPSASWEAKAPDHRPLHPRRHNLGKHYRYRIRCTPQRDPLTHRFEWHFGRALDHELMQHAARAFVGKHDFSSFRAAGCEARSPLRDIDEVRVSVRSETAVAIGGDPGRAPDPDGPSILEVDVHGSSFLMHMVRIMVGTLVDVGQGRSSPDCVEELLRLSDRPKAGPTAPAGGLTLMEVKWPTAWPPVG